MITEDYVSFETAKLLREKGFEEVCSAHYEDFEKKQYLYMRDKRGNYNIGFKQRDDLENRFNLPKERYKCAAPTLQMAMKWLREVHNIDIIAPPQYDNSKWTYSAIIFKLSIPCTEIRLNDNKDKKEEACEAAIKYCLENLI